MATAATTQRLTTLEQALKELAHAQIRTEEAHARTEATLDSLTAAQKGSDERFEQRMADLSQRVDATSRAVAASSERQDRTTRQRGELSNKMGTLAEDLVAPSIPEIFCRLFGDTKKPSWAVRVRCQHPDNAGRSQEYDVVAYADDVLLINETRTPISPPDIDRFLDKFRQAREYLPQAQGRKIFGSLGSFYVDPSLVKRAERAGLLIIGLGSGLMEILNSPDFKPREL